MRPKLARIRIVQTTDDRLVVDYHPVSFLVGGLAMTALCYWAGIRYWGSADTPVWPAFLFGTAFFAGFVLLFYRRMTLTFDRPSGQITQYKRTLLFRRRTVSFPLDAFTGVALQSSAQGDGAFFFQRGVLQFSDRPAVPMTLAMMTGGSPAEAAEAINTWAGTMGRYQQ